MIALALLTIHALERLDLNNKKLNKRTRAME